MNKILETVKELLSLMDDLESALKKNDHYEIGRIMFSMRDKLNNLIDVKHI